MTTIAHAEAEAPDIDAAEREALTVLVTVDGLGTMTLARLLERRGPATSVLDLARRGAPAIPDLIAACTPERGATEHEAEVLARLAQAIVDSARTEPVVLADVRASGLTVIALGEPAYPARLASIAAPPHVLFIHGDPAALHGERCVAIVGTRRPTAAGRITATQIATALNRAEVTVMSGLAVGIDGAAHAAVVAEGGTTVAVIAGGHARLFPAAHRALARAVVKAGGAIVSEHPPRLEPTKWMFPRRNRIISGLADATIVVEAGARSGALITAAWALEQGRGCFLVPGAIDAPMSAGCLAFLRECAGVAQIVTGIPQLLEDLGVAVPLRRSASRARATTSPPPTSRPLPASPDALLSGLPASTRMVAEEVLAGHSTPDELVALTGLPIGAVLSALSILATRGLVTGTYGRYHPAGPLVRAATPKVTDRTG
jgi:DNA processing protein